MNLNNQKINPPPKRHIAEQLTSPVIDPPVILSLTIKLKGDSATAWRRHDHAMTKILGVPPTNAQLATALIIRALNQPGPNHET